MEERRDAFGASVGLLILRVGLGGFMASHGWGKVQMVLDGRLGEFADPIGLGSGVSLVFAAGAEFVCAILVMAGLLTRFAAAAVAFTMGVAAFVVHSADPWSMGEGARRFLEKEAESWSSKEPALLFLVPFLALVFTGPGRFSLDAHLAARRAARGAAKAKS